MKIVKNKILLYSGTDINESELEFFPNQKGGIRFGMSVIKNVWEQTTKDIVAERNKNGPYKSIFDIVQRVAPKSLNKKRLESLAMAGAFDSFKDTHRA